MIKKSSLLPVKPSRVVVLGAKGFVGSAVVKALLVEGINVLSLGKDQIDLLSDGASEKLNETLNSEDVLIFVAAKAPCKNLEMFSENLRMVQIVCNVIKEKRLSQLVYISSDAVYKDSLSLISESSCAEPNSLHGAMHLTREIALKENFSGPITIIRPTLIYGVDDPHNGYGPNRFLREVIKGQQISLFGEGEELRDHIAVEDLAALVRQVVLFKAEGVVNAVSGRTVSFRQLAELITNKMENSARVCTAPRVGKIPHNGYRAFDNSYLLTEFPEIPFMSWESGILKLCESIKSD